MAWTAPMTAVAGNIFKASEFNTHIRDNLMETAPAFTSPNGAFYVTTGVNSISTTFPDPSGVTTAEETVSTTYTNLATVGPQNVDVDVHGFAVVYLGARIFNATASATARMSFEYTNAENPALSVSASDVWSIANTGIVPYQYGAAFVINTLPGTYTFTCKYKTDTAGTASFANRRMFILPF